MLPVRTENSSFIFRSADPDVPDMPGERIESGHIRSVWQLTEWERVDISQGGNIELNIFSEPIPPVSLNVTGEGATWEVPELVSAVYKGDDGNWYLRISFRDGVGLAESKGYARRWRAGLAQRRLTKILPRLATWPTS